MLSSEHGFRPREIYAPVDKSGSPPPGLSEQKKPQQIPSESPLNNPYFAIENTLPESNQDEISAIGQVAQSLAIPTEYREQQRQEIRGTIDLTSENARQTIRAARRERWKQTGEIAKIAGGAAKRHENPEETPQPTEFVDRETAKKRIEEFFSIQWDKKTKEGKKKI